MMKRFKILGLLFIGIIGFTSFSYGGLIFFKKSMNSSFSITASSTQQVSGGKCYASDNAYCMGALQVLTTDNTLIQNGFTTSDPQNSFICLGSGDYLFFNNRGASCTYYVMGYTDYSFCPTCEVCEECGECPTCPTCPTCEEQLTSTGCQQEYGLMPITSCNMEYCNANGYCPEYSGSVSSLYINGISHISAPVIDITIPLEYQWDYMLTGNIFNLVVSGNNVDTEYIDGIIRTQNTKPSNSDFNSIVTDLLPKFVPGLVIILFIIFIFRFIKKIF